MKKKIIGIFRRKIMVFGFGIVFALSSIFVVGSDNYDAGSCTINNSISGNVFQANGNPIFGATVEVIRQDEDGFWSVSSESDGSYSASDLPMGDYKVRVFKQGYAREYYDNVYYNSEATIIQLGASEEVTGIDFSLDLGGSISGRIHDDETEAPIGNAQVWVSPCIEVDLDKFEVDVDYEGKYKVECLALGLYYVGVSANGYSSECYDNVWGCGEPVEVTPPDDTSDINFGLTRSGSISGYVFDNEGNPVPEAEVEAWNHSPYGDCGNSAVTRWDGSYIIRDIPAWSYKVRVIKPGFAFEFYDSKNTWDSADEVTVQIGQNILNINFTIVPGGSITGKIYDEEDGTPIENILIDVYLPTGERINFLGNTGYTGEYTTWLGEGSYLLYTMVADAGFRYVPEWYDNSFNINDATPVDVIVNQETSDINFYLSKVGSISGHVYDDGGTPIGDASVYAFSDEFPGNGATTESDGSYIIEGVISGNYYVQATVLGYLPEYYDDATSQDDATLVTVNAPDDISDINFYLTPGDTQPPNKPTIDGPNSGTAGEEYTYTSSTTDPDDDQIYYLFDWGDETDSSWFGPFVSGETISSSHIWTEQGTYEIKVKAKDIYGVNSEWSDPLAVSMPKNKAIDNPFLRFLENHPHLFPLLRLLLRL